MKTHTFYTLLVLFLSVFLLPSTAQAIDADTTRLTATFSQENSPLIYKDTLVYRRHEAGVNIYGYDLKTNTETLLVDDYLIHSPSDLHEDLLVYSAYTQDPIDQYDVRALNLKTGEDTLIAGGPGSQTSGRTNGRQITYIDGYACGSLYVYDLRDQTREKIIEDTCHSYDLHSQTIVYPVNVPGGTDLYGYDLIRREHFPVAVEPGFQNLPHIYHNKVVWLDHYGQGTGDDYSIMMMNLNSGKQTVLYQNSTNSLDNPKISENYLVWSESSARHTMGMKAMDLRSGEIITLMDIGPHQNSRTSISIWKNTVAWMAWRTGNGDIYQATLAR